jgi:hypothetical protein
MTSYVTHAAAAIASKSCVAHNSNVSCTCPLQDSIIFAEGTTEPAVKKSWLFRDFSLLPEGFVGHTTLVGRTLVKSGAVRWGQLSYQLGSRPALQIKVNKITALVRGRSSRVTKGSQEC